MSDDRELVDQLRLMLGAPSALQVPAALDERVLSMARRAAQPAPVQQRAPGPPVLAWVAAISAGLVALAVWLAWPLQVAFPVSLSPLGRAIAAGYLLTLLASSPILIRR